MPIPRPDLTIKNIKRYRAIAGVFVKYGFGEIVDRLNLRAAFKFGKRVLRRKPSPDLSLPQRIRLALEELGPHLIGMDPTRLGALNQRMDRALKGHPYVKTGIDMACWDILGKVSGLSVCELLGGRFGDDFHLYRAISQDEPDRMAARVEGYRSEGYRRSIQQNTSPACRAQYYSCLACPN